MTTNFPNKNSFICVGEHNWSAPKCQVDIALEHYLYAILEASDWNTFPSFSGWQANAEDYFPFDTNTTLTRELATPGWPFMMATEDTRVVITLSKAYDTDDFESAPISLKSIVAGSANRKYPSKEEAGKPIEPPDSIPPVSNFSPSGNNPPPVPPSSNNPPSGNPPLVPDSDDDSEDEEKTTLLQRFRKVPCLYYKTAHKVTKTWCASFGMREATLSGAGNSHPNAASYRNKAFWSILNRCIPDGIQHFTVLDYFGSARNLRFNSVPGLTVISGPDTPVQGDAARQFFRSQLPEMCDVVIIQDVYQDTKNWRTALLPGNIKGLCDLALSGECYILAREFSGMAGSDSSLYQEGIWVRDLNDPEMIIFKPDMEGMCYAAHPSLDWLTTHRSYDGLDISDIASFGPYKLYCVTRTKPNAIQIGGNGRVFSPPQRVSSIFVQTSPTWSFVPSCVTKIYDFLTGAAESRECWVDTPLFYNKSLLYQNKPITAQLMDSITACVYAYMNSEPLYIQMLTAFPRIRAKIAEDTVFALLYSDRIERSLDNAKLAEQFQSSNSAMTFGRMGHSKVEKFNSGFNSWLPYLGGAFCIAATALSVWRCRKNAVPKPAGTFDLASFLSPLVRASATWIKTFLESPVKGAALFIWTKWLDPNSSYVMATGFLACLAFNSIFHTFLDKIKASAHGAKKILIFQILYTFVPIYNMKALVAPAIEETDTTYMDPLILFGECLPKLLICAQNPDSFWMLAPSLLLHLGNRCIWRQNKKLRVILHTLLNFTMCYPSFEVMMAPDALPNPALITAGCLSLFSSIVPPSSSLTLPISLGTNWSATISKPILKGNRESVDKTLKIVLNGEPVTFTEAVSKLEVLQDSRPEPLRIYPLLCPIVEPDEYHPDLYSDSAPSGRYLFGRPSNSPLNLLCCLAQRTWAEPEHQPIKGVWSTLHLQCRELFFSGRVFTCKPSFEQAISGMPGPKKDRMRNAMERLLSTGYFPAESVSVSIKTDEVIPFKPHLLLKPRAIFQIKPEYLALTTQHNHMMSDLLHEIWNEDVTFHLGDRTCFFIYASGYTSTQLDHLMGRILSDPLCDYYVVAGDDNLTVMWNPQIRTQVFEENDFSMYDQTQGPDSLSDDREDLLSLGLDPELAALEVACLTLPYKIIHMTKHIRMTIAFSMDPIQGSGRGSTTWGNSSRNIKFGVYRLSNRTLSTKQAAINLGFTIKTKSSSDITDLTFLKGWWCPFLDGSYHWLPLPSMILKLGKMLRHPNDIFPGEPLDVAYRKCAFALSRSPGAVPLDYPILGPFISAMSRVGIYTDTPLAHKKFCIVVQSVNAPLDRDAMISKLHRRYGLTYEEIVEIEALFNSVTSLPVLYTSTVSTKLMADYE
jgi:hypothetical protein